MVEERDFDAIRPVFFLPPSLDRRRPLGDNNLHRHATGRLI